MVYVPDNATGHETFVTGQQATPLGRQIFFKDGIYPLWELPNLSDNTPAALLSHGAGTASLAEINSSEICGLTLDADNESYGYLWVLPQVIDLSEDISFRYLESNSEAAATGTNLWVTKYLAITAGTTALAVGSVALDTVHTAQADVAANVPQWSPWGSIAASKTGVVTLTPGDDMLALKSYVDITTIANVTVYKAQVRYSSKYMLPG